MEKLTVKDAVLNSRRVNIHIESGLIRRISDAGREDAGPEPGEDVFDARGMHVIPGLHNGHTHSGMNALRGLADDMPLMPWLETAIWPAEARLSREDIYWSARFAVLEMIRGGTTFFSDMYWHRDLIVRAVSESGIRARLSEPVLDLGNSEKRDRDRQLMLDAYDRASQDPTGIQMSLAPHAVYTVSRPQLEWVGRFSAEKNLPIHIHCSETEQEVKNCYKETALSPVQYLDQLGCLTERTVLAHAVWVDESDLDLIAERGAAVVTNPVSNAKLAVNRLFPWPEYRKRGIPVCVGTDSVASNNALNLLNDVKFLSLSLKHHYNDASLLTADECMDLLTRDAAAIHGLNSGEIAEGQAADMVFLDPEHVSMHPLHSLHSSLVYGEAVQAVDSVMVAGRFVMERGHVRGQTEILEHIRHIAGKIRAS